MAARRIPVVLTADIEKYLADIKHATGFRRRTRFGQAWIGWRIWVGPLILARVPECRTGYWHEKGLGWTVTLLGISVGWTR